MKRPENPKLLVDKIAKLFVKAVSRAERKGSNEINFKATSVMKSKKQSMLNAAMSPSGTKAGRFGQSSRVEVSPPASINPYPLLTKEERINEKVHQVAKETIREPSKTT